MRVISGKSKGMKLFSPTDDSVRPTADRIKEAVFSMISDYIFETAFLDLFSGTGSIGIEAISRGATRAYFVDNNIKSLKILEKNLEKTRFLDCAEILKKDYIKAIGELGSKNQKFDIIFMDPPYYGEFICNALYKISENNILKNEGIVIIESAHNQELDIDNKYGFEIIKVKHYNIANITLCKLI